MSETKPQKRLVSKGRYIELMGKKFGKYAYAILIGGIGMTLMVAIFCQAFGGSAYGREDKIFCSVLLCSIPCYLFFYAKRAFHEAKHIEVVHPITDRNAYLLPAEDTLLRGSDLPPTKHQAELLRATQTGQETPQEQLLRATAGGE